MGAGVGTHVGGTVVRKVAAREDVAPVDLDPPLYDVLDPDALDALFADTGDDPGTVDDHVAFRYLGYTVVVTGDGRVYVGGEGE